MPTDRTDGTQRGLPDKCVRRVARSALRDTTVKREQPSRVIVADARRHGVPILPVDVNRSRPGHSVEQTPQGWGVRLAFATIKDITAAETARLAAGQPYTNLQDLWQRARPSLPLAQRLIRIGALDELAAELTRRDLLLQAAELHRQYRNRAATDGQLPLGGELVTAGPSGLPEMTSRDKLSAELDTLSIDVSQHLMEHHHRLLRELGATDAAHLRSMIPGQPVLVAGVRASTQTPPIPSGKRVIFVTLEDDSGLVDIAFFEDSHEACAHTVFHSGLLLVRFTDHFSLARVTRWRGLRGPRVPVYRSRKASSRCAYEGGVAGANWVGPGRHSRPGDEAGGRRLVVHDRLAGLLSRSGSGRLFAYARGQRIAEDVRVLPR